MPAKPEDSDDIKELRKKVETLTEKVETMVELTQKTGKVKKPKDPNRKPSAYMLFCKKKHEEFKKEGLHTDKKMGEKSKIIAELWKEEKKGKED